MDVLKTLCLGWLVLCIAGPPAAAQEQQRLDPAIISSNSSWNQARRSIAEQFIQQQVDLILSGEEDQMVIGRNALIEPFGTPGATDLFKQQFSQAIIERIGAALESESVQVRINALVVCGWLTHAGGFALIIPFLDDPAAGVRFRAGQAVANLLRAAEADAQQRQRALDALENRIDVEDSPFVVAPLLAAMLEAGGPGRVLDAINRRLDWHIARPEAGFDPEQSALFEVYLQLATSSETTPENLRQLARASARYMLLAAQQLAKGVSSSIQRSHVQIIKTAHTSLAFASDQLGAPGRRPGDPSPALNIDNWEEVRDIAQAWIAYLREPPFNFTAEQLEVVEPGTEPDAPEAE